jgi:hypothetical protein
MKNEVYRVTEEGTDTRFGGYRNDTKLFNTIKGARQARNQEAQNHERYNSYRERRGEPLEPMPVFKIQKSALVWEDVE